MRCRKVKYLLALFLDGQLSVGKTLKVKAHLDKCPVCSKELNLLRETWDLLGEWRPVIPSPDFQARLWQRILQEETVTEKRPLFVFPRLKPQLVPVFATLGVILIVSAYLLNFYSGQNIQQLALNSKDEDLSMLKELDLLEELDIIQNIHILEELEIIDSVKL